MSLNSKDTAAGALFMAIGLIIGLHAYLSLDLGAALNMGPGYFPVVLSGLLFVLGAAILARSARVPSDAWGPVSWRGVLAILGGPILFGLTIEGLGLVPALGALIFTTAFASRRMTPRLAIPLTGGLVLLCVAIFIWGLGSPLHLSGPWLAALGLGR